MNETEEDREFIVSFLLHTIYDEECRVKTWDEWGCDVTRIKARIAKHFLELKRMGYSKEMVVSLINENQLDYEMIGISLECKRVCYHNAKYEQQELKKNPGILNWEVEAPCADMIDCIDCKEYRKITPEETERIENMEDLDTGEDLLTGKELELYDDAMSIEAERFSEIRKRYKNEVDND